jgi:5-methylcytosine-specific restriction endonuclease McrA
VCHQEFPRTAEFWHKQPRRTDGLSETCKACAKKRARDWHLANLERARAANRKNREEHPEKVVARRIRYRDENPERIRSSRLDFYRRNREKRIAYSARWRLDNPEKAAASRKREYENNKELAKQRAHDWVQANPERVKLRTARRRAAQKNAPGHFTEDDLVRQFEKQQGKCFYCHEDLQVGGTIDHYVPLSKGGTNYPSNIVLACWPCNNRKRAKFPSEFLPRR